MKECDFWVINTNFNQVPIKTLIWKAKKSKKPVRMMTTTDEVNMATVKNYLDEEIQKPEAVLNYNRFKGAVDTFD